MKNQPLWNRNFLAVCFSSFFLFMTFYTLAVTLPMFATDTLRVDEKQIGLVMTVFVVAAVLFRPLAGKWVDELNRKKLVFISLALFMVCTILYIEINSFSALLALRFLHGVAFGIATTATGTIVLDLIPDHRKGEGIGYFSLFMSLAMVIGPFVGLTIITNYGAFILFTACIIFALLSFLCAIMARIPKRTIEKKTEQASGWKTFIEPKAIPISLSGSLLAFSYGAITTFISVYAKELGMEQIASYFFVVFATMIVLPRPITGKLFDRLGENALVYPGIFLFTVGMIGLSQAHTPFVFLVAGGLIGLGYGVLLPSFQAIAVKSAPSHRRGLATATYFVLFDSGYGLGSYVLGIVASETNYHTMYFIGGLIVACTAVIYYALHHKKTVLSKAHL